MKKIKNIFTSILTFNNFKTLIIIMFLTYLISNDHNIKNIIIAGTIYIVIAIILSTLIEFNIIKIKNGNDNN